MIRRIINIDEEKCNGCGACAKACHEGAIGMVNGKAKLLRDDYCDGLGDCLPTCPTGAITFVEREAAAYDEQAVKANMEKKAQKAKIPCGCPGSQAKAFNRENISETEKLFCKNCTCQQTSAVACTDKACANKRTLFQRSKASYCRRLHRLCICKLPRGIYKRKNHIDRMSEAGRS